MSLRIEFLKSPAKGTKTAVLFVAQGGGLDAAGMALDKQAGGYITHALAQHAAFKGKAGEVLSLVLPKGAPFQKLLLAGIGQPAEPLKRYYEDMGGRLLPALQACGEAKVAVFTGDFVPAPKGAKASAGKRGGLKDQASTLAACVAQGLALRGYRFEKYKPRPESKTDKNAQEGAQSRLSHIEIITADPVKASQAFKDSRALIEGIFSARDFVNEPPNVLYPDAYARRIAAELSPLGVKVEIFDEKQMQKMGMNGILAIGMGSVRKPRLVVMHWQGGKKAEGKTARGKKSGGVPLALVGKGVTFDTGGISLKPGPGMEEMKMDMAGSAAVVGVIKALALRKAACEVVGIVPLAENMPSGDACRPADIITSYAGKTIEILNTDAEGRVILVDAMAYVQKTYRPKTMIDLATLTGAMLIALGQEYCGTFANDDALWDKLSAASKNTGEKLWRMPLDEVWRKEMESPVADLQNIAKNGRNAGSCTAAGFLEHFVESGVAWAHLDIAGTAWIKADRPTVPKYGTGFGVALLHDFIRDNYER